MSGYNRAWKARNPGKYAGYYRKYNKANPDRFYAYRLNSEFGITLAQYRGILKSQGGLCGICGSAPPSRGRSRRLQVDHDHTTGKVRGVLCRSCNLGLGNFKDSRVTLAKASKYLKTHEH